MTVLKILLAEMAYRKVPWAMSLVAVVVAVMLFVVGPVLVDGYRQATEVQIEQWRARLADLENGVSALRASMERVEKQTAQELDRLEAETRRLMRDLGFNLLIVHRDTNMSDFWAEDFAAYDMPEQYVERLASDRRLTLVTHLVATLQAKIEWENRKVLLVGYLPEATQPHMRQKAPMGYRIEPGTVLVGHELGVGRRIGEVLHIRGRPLTIAQILPEKGSKEDITLAVHLHDAQALLDKPGRINQILALGCRCSHSDLPNIRQQLAAVLPATQLPEFRTLALARAEQRSLVEAQRQAILSQMERNLQERQKVLAERRQVTADMERSRLQILAIMETLAAVLTPLVVLAAAVWVGLLSLANVRQRRAEIGLLRALGKGSWTIATLFLGKAVLIGLLGAAVGVVLGVIAAYWLGTRAFQLEPHQFQVPATLLLGALLGAPLVSALASYLPTLTALLEDPAVVLREP